MVFHCQCMSYSNRSLIQRTAGSNRHRRIMELILWSSTAATLLCTAGWVTVIWLRFGRAVVILHFDQNTLHNRGRAVGSRAYGPSSCPAAAAELSLAWSKWLWWRESIPTLPALQILESEALRWHFYCNCLLCTTIWQTQWKQMLLTIDK